MRTAAEPAVRVVLPERTLEMVTPMAMVTGAEMVTHEPGVGLL